MGYLYSYGQVLEPVSVAEARAHLRVDFADDDAYIATLISAARWKLEREYRRAMLQQTLVLGLDYFGNPEKTREIMFPVSFWPPSGFQYPINSTIDLRPPVSSITTVKYYDPSGVLQTLSSANYSFEANSEPNRLFPVLGKLWPSTAAIPNAVQITFVAGHATPDLVPWNQKLALLLIVGNFYANREESVIGTRLVALELPDGVRKLMAGYKFPLVR